MDTDAPCAVGPSGGAHVTGRRGEGGAAAPLEGDGLLVKPVSLVELGEGEDPVARRRRL